MVRKFILLLFVVLTFSLDAQVLDHLSFKKRDASTLQVSYILADSLKQVGIFAYPTLELKDSTQSKVVFNNTFYKIELINGINSFPLFIPSEYSGIYYGKVTLSFLEQVKINKAKHYLASTIFPGLTVNQLDNKSHLMNGVAGYLLVGGALFTNYLTNQYYKEYLGAQTVDARNTLFGKTTTFRYLTIGLSVSATIPWIWSYYQINKKSKKINSDNMKEISPYYFEISQTNEFQSSTDFQRLDLRNDVTIALEYGELYFQQKRYYESFLEFEKAYQLRAANPDIEKKYLKAKALYEEEKEKENKYAKYLVDAKTSIDARNYDSAHYYAGKAQEIYPERTDAIDLQIQIETFQEAQNKSIAFESNLNKGDLYLKKQEFANAIYYYDEALKTEPASEKAKLKRKVCLDNYRLKVIKEAELLLNGNAQKAIDVLEQFLKISPMDQEVIALKKKIERSSVYVENTWSIWEELWSNGTYKIEARFYVDGNGCERNSFSKCEIREQNPRYRPYYFTQLDFNLQVLDCKYGNSKRTEYIHLLFKPSQEKELLQSFNIISNSILTKPENISIRKSEIFTFKEPAQLSISNISFVTAGSSDVKILDAGESATIEVEINNKTPNPISGAYVELNIQVYPEGLDVRPTYPISLIPPGKSTHHLKISGSEKLQTGTFKTLVQIRDFHGFDSEAASFEFTTQKYQPPLVKVADHGFSSIAGGKITVMQTIYLDIIIQNKGQGVASNVDVAISCPAEVLPLNGSEFHYDALDPNQSVSIKYQFIANNQYNKPSIPIEIKVTESKGLYGDNTTATVNLEEVLPKMKIFDETQAIEQNIIDEKSLVSDIDKDIPITSQKRENTFALIIGNEDYSSMQKGLSAEVNVPFAVNDAKSFAVYCEKTLGIDKKNISILYNATSAQMKQAINNLKRLSNIKGNNAEIVLFYAGHGLPDQETKDAYLIPVDVNNSNISDGIKLEDLYKDLTELKPKKVIVFLDACFSGGARNQQLYSARGVKLTPKNYGLMGNIVVFSASLGTENALTYDEKKHGFFTYFLLKKIKETKGDLTLEELQKYIEEKVPFETLRVKAQNQTPSIQTSPELIEAYKKLKL
jgi:tetratricopeptide (TPR) repeat protein